MDKKIFQAFYDEKDIIVAKLSLNYYNGISDKFSVVDIEGNYLSVKIIDEVVDEDFRSYRLLVKNLELNKKYYVVDERFLRVELIYRYIVRTREFDELFFYDGDDLGFSYTKEKTLFKVWSPVADRIILDTSIGVFEMTKDKNGVFYITIDKNLDGVLYSYLININGLWNEATDPYAIASSPNHEKSVVIDKEKINIDLNLDKCSELHSITDSIIYEAHIRDFSSKASSGIKNSRKFLGMIEEGTRNSKGDITGFDYLVNLGITHVQLLPIYDFGSVDELNQESHYNWGYDPVQYNVPEGSYSTDSKNPYSRNLELKQLVAKFHEKGIRVIMDVVYNHMFDRFTSSFEKIAPFYYFRIENGEESNGSFCGNDFDSTRLMGRKFILDSVSHWMKEYGVDGFRFDLMGILDIKTMNQISDLVSNINKNAIVYGEGWNMPTLLDDKDKATLMNQDKMNNISHFNDLFRDTIKGSTMVEDIHQRGIATDDIRNISKLPNLLLGSEFDFDLNKFFSSPKKSINYVECHDNHTVYDKMIACNIEKDEIIDRHKLMIALVMFSKGVPFIHSGQEFLRTKEGDHNSYRSSDYVNGLDWDRMSEYKAVVNYFKDTIKIRKSIDVFKSDEYSNKIKSKVKKFKNIVEIKYEDNTKLIINLSKKDYDVKLNKEKLIFNKDGIVNKEYDEYTVKPLELIITKK